MQRHTRKKVHRGNRSDVMMCPIALQQGWEMGRKKKHMIPFQCLSTASHNKVLFVLWPYWDLVSLILYLSIVYSISIVNLWYIQDSFYSRSTYCICILLTLSTPTVLQEMNKKNILYSIWDGQPVYSFAKRENYFQFSVFSVCWCCTDLLNFPAAIDLDKNSKPILENYKTEGMVVDDISKKSPS